VRRRCEPCFDGPIERIGGRRPWNDPHGGDGYGGGIVNVDTATSDKGAEIVNARHNR
jgi:hypothetical protein